MYLLTVELKDFSAAHRLVKGYVGKCNSLHGHNYSLRVVIASEVLAQTGLVIDFAEIRTLCNHWVQSHLDHSTLVYQGDEELLEFVKTQQQKFYEFVDNTSVEVVAREIHNALAIIFARASQHAGIDFHLHQVEVWESQQCGVVYKRSGLSQTYGE